MQGIMEFDIEENDSQIQTKMNKRQKRIRPATDPKTQSLLMSFGSEVAGEFGPWITTTKTDRDCLALADRHYSRVTVGSSFFTRPGDNLVLRSQMGDATWVSWYSKKRIDSFKDVIECTTYRNESAYLSSDLVRWAIYASIQKWGIPEEGFITFVKDSAVRSIFPGANYLHAGFKNVGLSKARKLTTLQLLPEDVPAVIAEVALVYRLLQLKEHIQIAINSGEFMEAIDFFRMAKGTEQELRSKKSERARRKGRKWDCFEPNEDSLDFLFSICPDDWVPEELLDILEEEDSILNK